MIDLLASGTISTPRPSLSHACLALVLSGWLVSYPRPPRTWTTLMDRMYIHPLSLCIPRSTFNSRYRRSLTSLLLGFQTRQMLRRCRVYYSPGSNAWRTPTAVFERSFSPPLVFLQCIHPQKTRLWSVSRRSYFTRNGSFCAAHLWSFYGLAGRPVAWRPRWRVWQMRGMKVYLRGLRRWLCRE